MEELRTKLHSLISQGYNLVDSQVVQVSQELDLEVVKAQREE